MRASETETELHVHLQPTSPNPPLGTISSSLTRSLTHSLIYLSCISGCLFARPPLPPTPFWPGVVVQVSMWTDLFSARVFARPILTTTTINTCLPTL